MTETLFDYSSTDATAWAGEFRRRLLIAHPEVEGLEDALDLNWLITWFAMCINARKIEQAEWVMVDPSLTEEEVRDRMQVTSTGEDARTPVQSRSAESPAEPKPPKHRSSGGTRVAAKG